ncbi:P-loop containing nucleoside triphosphate hydrolase protein [Aspergillus bertholletiae]|uniref:P-loop containing nucleoside triphosphate hydrolase protein n=1 Tax=Aspergillus bertholletiae TaxID=1226010 RepID=A0A5N7BLQ5_9EURO|nr:P-loop containing nucleoside triphosphate hydrolase protein [Aspergillus bertholletiae]
MSLRRLLNPTDDDTEDGWADDMRRVRPRLEEALNPAGDQLESTVYPIDMSFDHSFGDQGTMFVDHAGTLPRLDSILFDQVSFLQPPTDVGLSGTSMTSTPGVEFTNGPANSVDVSMMDVAPNAQGEQLVHEKVKFVGNGQELETKILALRESSPHIRTLHIQSSTNGSLFLKFPDGADLGYLSNKMEQVLERLIGLPLFEIDALTNINFLIDSLRRAGKPDAATRVNINVYGRRSDRDKVGRELSKRDLFLQHPDDYRVGVEYDNPHILRLDGMDDTGPEDEEDEEDEEDITEVEESETTSERDEGFEETIAEVFNSLTRGDRLTQLGGSETLNRTLYQHQGEALDFMIQRETGNIADEYRLWQPKPVGGEQLYCHVITSNEQRAQPDESGGGILADEMGMGKSLTTLVLIAKTLREAGQWVEDTKSLSGTSLAEMPTRATLVVVPSHVLINTWEREINNHLNAGMKMMRYHGRSRKELISNIGGYDIVITTYNTLAKEHDAKILGKGQSPLHDFAWYRIVLDEVRATKRKAIERLTLLLEAVCLRRTIERVGLPGQHSEIHDVQFTPQERVKYELTMKDMQRFIHQQAGEYNQQTEAFGCRQPLPVTPHGRRPNIIFSCWTRTLDLIARHLKASSIEFERIDGKTSPSQRQKILDKFDSTRAAPVLIMTTGTGAFGLNLQSVNRVFIVEPQWNPSVESQAIARAIRLGQEQQVLVTRYRVKNSIEKDMFSQQTQKLKISQMDFRKDLEASDTRDD